MEFRKRLAQWVLLTSILILTSLLGFGIWRGKERSDYQAAMEHPKIEADMKLTDMEYTEMQQGRKLWTLNAEEARYFEKERKSLLTSVRLVFFLEGGGEVHLESREGMLYAGTKDIDLWGDVRATVPQGYTLASEMVSYRHKDSTITSETPVKVTGSELQVEGNRWGYIIPERKAYVEDRVEATLLPVTASTR